MSDVKTYECSNIHISKETGEKEVKVDFIDNMHSVDDWFLWISSKGQTVEQIRKKQIKDLKWEYPDVLYSFLGIYTLGVMAYYKDDSQEISLAGILIKNKDGYNLYNRKFLSENYRKYRMLNEVEELRIFIEHYSSIGNVCPTWPGGNEHRGKSHCYDIPDVYFKRHENWYRELVTQNPAAFLNNVVNSVYAVETAKLLEMVDTPEGYVDFLQHVNGVIDERNKLLSKLNR